MAFSPPEYCRLFAQKKAYQEGFTGTPVPPPPSPSYAPGLIAREQALHLGDIMNGRRGRGTRVPASPLARSRVLALLAQIGQLARRLNVFQVLVLASFLPEPGQKHFLSF